MNKLKNLLKTSSALAIITHFSFNSIAFAVNPVELALETRPSSRSSMKSKSNESNVDISAALTKSFIQESVRKDHLLEKITHAAEVAYTLRTNKPTDIQKQFRTQESAYEAGRGELSTQVMGAGLSLDNKSSTFAAETFNILSGDTLLGRLTHADTRQDSYDLTIKLINMGAAVYSIDSENLKERLEKSKEAAAYSQVYKEIEIIHDNIQALQDFQVQLLSDLKKEKKKSVAEIFQGHLDTLSVMHSTLYQEIKDKKITSTDQLRDAINTVAESLQKELKIKYLKQNQLYRQEVSKCG